MIGRGLRTGVAVLLTSQAFAAAGPLAYDGFNYAAGSPLSGANGGIGWSNSWVDVSGNLGEVVVSGSLAAGPDAPAGFDARSVGNATMVNINSRCGRWFNCSPGSALAQAGLLDANGLIGADGKTVYVSFLQQPSSPVRFYEFEFHRNDLGDGGRVAGIGNDALDNNVYLRRQSPPGGTSTFWNIGVGNTNVNLYVMRIDFKPGSDDVFVYRNPTGDTESQNEPVLTMISLSDMSFNGVSFGAYLNGVSVRHDEVRIGTTWSSVLGDPPAFAVQPTNQNLYAGQASSLMSLAQSSQPLTYQWYRGVVAIAGKTNANLSFASVQLSDAGQYFVTASNSLGVATSSPATLSIVPVTVDISGSQTVTIEAGSNLAITAAVGGTPPLDLQWYRDGSAIIGATNAAFLQAPASVFDAGVYQLVASSTYGSVTSAIVSVSPDFGGLLAYEGFGYSASTSDIGGANGGFGWASPWVNLDGASSQTLSTNLFAAGNGPMDYDTHSASGALAIANASRKGRFLDCSATGTFGLRGFVDTNGNIGATGKSLYLSFLQQPNGTSLFYEFEFHRNDLGDGGRIGGIGNDAAGTNVNLRAPNTVNNRSLGAGSTTVNCYVVRIDFKAGNDDVFIYRNPNSLTEPANPTLAVSNVADMSFDGISLAAYVNGRTVSHDEIRFGMSWADVLGTNRSQLHLAQRTNACSELRLAGSPNYTFGLQAAPNVTGPWTNIGSIVACSLGVGEFSETNASDRRFYRATNASIWLAPPSTDRVLADFEQPSYGTWVTTGTAFGPGPAQGSLPNQQAVSGYLGSGLVNSYYGTDASVGTLTSPPFLITEPFINFLIGGGAIPGQEGMNLIISNVVVKTATGANNEALMPQQWDVRDYVGQTAVIQIVDNATGSWGHINVDHITLTAAPLPALTREMTLTNSLLNLPVQDGAAMRRVTVIVGGQPVRDFNIRLATSDKPDWWAFVDVSVFSNQLATLSVSSLSSGRDGFYSIVQTNGIVGGADLYQETLRPQIHFTTKRGWLNDANAMVYQNGKYHLYYQHDPFDWGGGGQKWWGHAVSVDMVNWVEVPEGLYVHSYGDQVYSGSGIVDTNNTGGFKTGTNDVIVAAFTSTARGECIAFSNDDGLTFTEITNNPVVVHNGRDPHLLWYAPSNYWVMAVYDETGGGGISFYTSPTLRQWTYRSKINGYFECPDLFQLPVEGNTNNLMWLLCDASSGYQLGQFDGTTFAPTTAKLPGNNGSAFYASQTFTSMPPGDNRLVRIGWAIIATPGMPFNQMMYFPTELALRTTANGIRLCSTPIAEITNNAVHVYNWTNLTVSPGNNPLTGIRGNLFDVKAQFSVGTAQSITFTFQGVTVTYNATAQQISCNGVVNPLAPIGGTVQLEIIVDRKTIEIFGNNGQLYMPLPADNPDATRQISLSCTGGNATFNSLMVNKLKTIWAGPTP